MYKNIKNEAILNRKNKISFLYILIFLMMGIFLFSVFNTMTSKRRVPSNQTTIHDRSFRGDIISADGYTLSKSIKIYQAVIRGSSIKPEKRALFITLFSIYSGIPKKEISACFMNDKGEDIQGNIILSKTITSRSAMQLKALAYKFRKLQVFRSVKNRNGIEVVYGLDIIEIGEHRTFPLQDILSPTLGYVGDKPDGRYTRPSGKKGLERAYNKYITSKKNGYLKGKRDVLGAIIHDKNSINHARVDGLDLHLNIPIDLQRRVELMADQMRQSIDADEILVGIMESDTGKILSLVTTKRYDPSHIRQEDIASLVPKFTEYPYEAGSVLKPLTVAIALDANKITPNTWFDTGYKRFSITGGQHISDDDYFESMSVTDIIVHSSNIGVSQISWRITGETFRKGLLKFGIAKKTGIDLSRDLPGFLKSIKKLNHKMHRANSAFGYSMLVTFTQLMKAYSAFNNDGLAMSPHLVDYLQDAKGKKYQIPKKIGNTQAITKKTANQIHDMLNEVVKRGTGVKAQYQGLDVGGKTGTAYMIKDGRYTREYHSSFYGFANDKEGHKYTIGALVIRAKVPYKYFASESAVPTFRRTLDILVELDYLKPDGNITFLPEIKEYIPKIESNVSISPTKIHVRKAQAPIKAPSKSYSKHQTTKRTYPKKRVIVPKTRTYYKPKRNVYKKPKVQAKYKSFEDMF